MKVFQLFPGTFAEATAVSLQGPQALQLLQILFACEMCILERAYTSFNTVLRFPCTLDVMSPLFSQRYLELWLDGISFLLW